jgi:hypothetical protein
MIFQFQTKSVEAARLKFTESSLPKIYDFDTPLFYSAKIAGIVGTQGGFNPHMKVHEFALLTIKENGSAREGYQSVSTAVPYQVGMHIGAKLQDNFLIVSDIAENGELVRPAKLSLQDLVGYETLKTFK